MMRQKRTFKFNWHHIAAMLLASFAFFMSGLVSDRVFERMPHLEDEIAYLYQARVFARGNIVLESPEPASAYWMPFIVDSQETGNRFSKYTPGWSALLAIGVAMGQAWIVNAILAALAVALVYRLGREVFNPDIAVIAATLTAFSPAALLLNGSLMSHSSGLFFTMLFMYAYWRLEKGKRAHIWGAVAGLSLGILAATRPLTTLGIGLPFIAWSGVRLLMTILDQKDEKPLIPRTWNMLTPLLVLSAFTLLLAASIPAYSWVATGDPGQNLYELVWDYDKIGFGNGHGRNFHRIQKAFSHANFDLSLTAADLFGWQFEPFNSAMEEHVLLDSDFYEGTGYSFYLLIPGLLFGLFITNKRFSTYRAYWNYMSRRFIFLLVWMIIAYGWVWLPQNISYSRVDTQVEVDGQMETVTEGTATIDVFNLPVITVDEVGFSYFWVAMALLWLFVPLFYFYNFKETPTLPYVWLIFAVIGSVVIVQMLYWIGSQRYSTRYYYEALGSAALITAIPIAGLIRVISKTLNSSHARETNDGSISQNALMWRVATYGAFLLLCLFTLYNYSTPRISALYRFNNISPVLIEQVEAARVDDRPIVVVVVGAMSGENRVRWRSYGTLMYAMSPYFDSDIIVARDFGSSRQRLIEDYPDRQFITVYAIGNEARVQPSQPAQPPATDEDSP